MATLIFDIETSGEDFDELDQATQDSLTHWIRAESFNREEFEIRLQDLKNGMGFSPLTGEIVALGVYDCDRDQGVTYFQSPERDIEEFEDNDITFKPATEKEMLERFWDGIKNYNTFVTFNGRRFDVPFILIRSMANKVKSTKNLLSHRYLHSQMASAKHIDLLDQLSFYGALRKKGNLHLWSRLLGIDSPKSHGVTGDDVNQLFLDGEYEKIARYNALDLKATKELYQYWLDYLWF